MRRIFLCLLIVASFSAQMLAPVFVPAALAAANDEERKALEQQLAELEKQQTEQETVIKNLKAQGKTLKSETDRLTADAKRLELKIKEVTLQLAKLNYEIKDKEVQIRDTQDRIAFNKDALTRAVQGVYENSQTGLMEVLLASPRLSNFFTEFNNLVDVQDSLVGTINRITDLKNELMERKEFLALQRSDATALKSYRDSEKAKIEANKKEKEKLLVTTKGKETKFQQLLAETKKTAAQIRSQIFKLLGGGEMTFEQAYQFAKLAEGATGVRAALILAVLDRESALGQNVGKCTYNQINAVTGKPTMHPTRDAPYFLELTAALGINPTTVPVSCAITSDGTYGGAVGPAQFIPSTWKLYADAVSAVTGNKPPSPWSNPDAFIATGLYLKDAGALKNESKAAATYYCGSKWYLKSCKYYASKVISQADVFQSDIDVLSG